MPLRFLQLTSSFPRQFWILFGGTLVNAVGSGMVFPFLTLYLHQRLDLSMTFVGLLLAFWSTSALVGQLVGGALTDQFGRKKLMAASLVTGACIMSVFGLADSVLIAVPIVLAMGFTNALFQPARDAMIADLVGSESRIQAYGLMRVVANLGIAIGPAIGGLLASQSYLLTFWGNASATFLFFLVTLFLMRETRPAAAPIHRESAVLPGGFGAVLGDRRFIAFCAGTAITTLAYAPMMTILPVYMKEQFQLGEIFFGWVMTTNAGMVVLLQFPITRLTQRLPRLPLMAAGAILYGIGVASVFAGSSFPHFVTSMAVMTFGEMLFTPTATAVTADFAPAEMRGRYMGMLGLTISMGFGLGPLFGGVITDGVSPAAVWPIMGSVACASALLFLLLARFSPTRARQSAALETRRV